MHAAGTDPAFIPGLTPPRPDEAAECPPPVPADAAPETEAEEVAAEADETEAAAIEEEPPPVADGPVFEVSDRRGSITIDSTGVTFRLDDEKAEFGWPEVGAVETGTPWLARHLTVTVYTTGHRSYHAHIDAPSRKLLKQWATELDAALDSYFEDTKAT